MCETKMLTIPETAQYFGISQYYARQLALTGKVHAVRIGRNKILLNAKSIEDYFNSARLTDPEPDAPAKAGIRPVKLK